MFSPQILPLLFIYVTASSEKYPWLEQISRQETLSSGCDKLKPTNYKLDVKHLDHILVDRKHRFLYCYVPKVACTNWKRVLMLLTDQANSTNLLEIPAYLAHAENSTLKLSQLPKNEAISSLENYTSFIMVRHPFERLVSAYRNKFSDTAYSNYFHDRYGRYIIKKYRLEASTVEGGGENVTFHEFVSYLIKEGTSTNEHWMSVYDLCFPCSINYTLIGHYETLAEDTKTVLDMIGASQIRFPVQRSGHTKDVLKYYFQQLSIHEIRLLYQLYEKDFNLFGYNLEDIIGYDLG